MSGNSALRTVAAAVMIVVSAARIIGQAPLRSSGDYEALYARYLQQAQVQAQSVPPDPWGWMNGLAGDSRARRVNDLVSIRVEESITASGSADASLSKATNTNNSISGLFGLLGKLPSAIDPTTLANSKTDNGFKGSGATTRTGVLTTMLTARVADVLPSGDLVVEGAREIDINGDKQVVLLTGVVRVKDLSPENVVSSTSIGQLRVQYFGQGLLKDSLKPGWLVRVLNKIF
jgi:flagellar L-ring protein FlgH